MLGGLEGMKVNYQIYDKPRLCFHLLKEKHVLFHMFPVDCSRKYQISHRNNNFIEIGRKGATVGKVGSSVVLKSTSYGINAAWG